MSYTPGPWENQNNNYITDSGGIVISEIYHHHKCLEGCVTAEAQLIAMAPALLDTLSRLEMAVIQALKEDDLTNVADVSSLNRCERIPPARP